MRPLSPSPRRLAVIAAAIAALALTAGIAQATRDHGGPKPPPRPLVSAVMAAVGQAPKIEGVTADVKFTNNLIPPGTLPAGARTPLTAGADGHLALSPDGRFRLDLHSPDGELQIAGDGRRVSVWNPASKTEYRFTFDGGLRDALRGATGAGGGIGAITSLSKSLGPLLDQVTLSDAKPDTVAGRPAYTLRIAPKDDGGLLAAGEISWDAERGLPLRAAVYAQGTDEPVLELGLTKVAYGKVADAALQAPAHAPGKIINMDDDPAQGLPHHGAGAAPETVRGLAAVRAKVDFDVAAPDELAGLTRSSATLAADGKDSGAVLTYGTGLGSIVVVQWPSRRAGPLAGLPLPEVNVDGGTGKELATALGTIVTFDRDGVSYLVAGFVPPVSAENAARGLR